jgi:hypothetical protein
MQNVFITIINYPETPFVRTQNFEPVKTHRRCGREKSIIGAHYRFSNGATNHTLSLSSIGIGWVVADDIIPTLLWHTVGV